jgi:hypothetical protein
MEELEERAEMADRMILLVVRRGGGGGGGRGGRGILGSCCCCCGVDSPLPSRCWRSRHDPTSVSRNFNAGTESIRHCFGCTELMTLVYDNSIEVDLHEEMSITTLSPELADTIKRSNDKVELGELGSIRLVLIP